MKAFRRIPLFSVLLLLPLLAVPLHAQETGAPDPAGVRRLDALVLDEVIPFFDQVRLPRWDMPGAALRLVDLDPYLEEIAFKARAVEGGAVIQEAVSFVRDAVRRGLLEGAAADNGIDNPFLGFRYMESGAGDGARICAPEPFFENAVHDRPLFLSSLVFAARYAYRQSAGPTLRVPSGGRSLADEYADWMDAVLRQALYLRDGEGVAAMADGGASAYLVQTLAEDGLEGYSRLILGLRQDLAHETLSYYRKSLSVEDLTGYLEALEAGLASFNAMLEDGALSLDDTDLRFQALVVANTYLTVVPWILYDVSARHPLTAGADPLVPSVRSLTDRLIRLGSLAHPRTSELLAMLEFVLAGFNR